MNFPLNWVFIQILFIFISQIFQKSECFFIASQFRTFGKRGFLYLNQKTKFKQRNPRREIITARGTGETQGYSWVEDEFEIEVRIAVPSTTLTKQVHLDVHRQRIRMTLDGRDEPLITGQLRGNIAIDESFWTMEDEGNQKMIYLRLGKPAGSENMQSWEGVLADETPTSKDYSEEDFDAEEYVEKMGGINKDLIDPSMYSLDKLDPEALSSMQNPSNLKDFYDKFGSDDAGIDVPNS